MSLQEVKIYSPHRNQRLIIQDKARFKVVACGRRFGKTTMAVGELVISALTTPKSTWWYIAPTYRQAKNIAWRMLLNFYYDLPAELRGQKNESELWVEIGNGGRIELKGADNEDSLRGVKLNGVVADEVASMKHWDTLWEEVLRPSLTDLRGTGLFISTPKGFNHFYKLFDLENDDLRGRDFRSFRFTSYDNPLLDRAEIEKAQVELTEDAFAQEYLADFRKQTGLIYKEFDRKIHIKHDFDLNLGWQYYRAMDFGAVNPTVCLWIAIDNSDNIYVFDEYYNTGQTAQFHANVIKGKTSGDYPIIATYGDPSAQQEILDYANYGVFITPAAKIFTREGDWVNSGIEKVRQALKVHPQTGRPRIYIASRCVNTIREFEAYHWLEFKTSDVVKDVPDKVDDHCMDALRYFVVSYAKPEFSYEIKFNEPSNQFTGYGPAQIN